MPQLELRLPPPLIAVLTGLLMWISANWLAQPGFNDLTANVLGYGFCAIGALLLVPSILSFRTFTTTINPTRPEQSSQLITTGVFGISRNPIYLGMLLLLIGWWFWVSNLISLLLVVVFFAYMTRFQIIPEERALQSIFGERFASYRKRVRRWI